MARSPYRNPAPPNPDSPERPAAPLDIALVAGLLWIASVARVTAALLHEEPLGRELTLAWLVVFFAPVIIWKELEARVRSPP